MKKQCKWQIQGYLGFVVEHGDFLTDESQTWFFAMIEITILGKIEKLQAPEKQIYKLSIGGFFRHGDRKSSFRREAFFIFFFTSHRFCKL